MVSAMSTSASSMVSEAQPRILDATSSSSHAFAVRELTSAPQLGRRAGPRRTPTPPVAPTMSPVSPGPGLTASTARGPSRRPAGSPRPVRTRARPSGEAATRTDGAGVAVGAAVADGPGGTTTPAQPAHTSAASRTEVVARRTSGGYLAGWRACDAPRGRLFRRADGTRGPGCRQRAMHGYRFCIVRHSVLRSRDARLDPRSVSPGVSPMTTTFEPIPAHVGTFLVQMGAVSVVDQYRAGTLPHLATVRRHDRPAVRAAGRQRSAVGRRRRRAVRPGVGLCPGRRRLRREGRGA